ncbi:copper amine oxidase N-terminal domain-containing protein [Desulfotomaculum copahuensis]|uniref:copper amine oxidase N-terminal domain-containing protein n=1 Tax=Desulfotomaculum copahuensis TaxID=1838280 RepID=UPI00098FA240|nr:copper amine oxidase N-terminal domain-containing protein [Desulfotomaculum copahuensis]
MGASVDWNTWDQQATVSLNGKTIALGIGKSIAMVDGKETPIDPDNPGVVSMMASPGRLMIPLRFIAENLGCKVDRDQAGETVTVTYPGS